MILENISFLVKGAAALLVVVLVVRIFFKFAWKFVRAGLIVIAILVVVGYLTGFLEIVFR